MVDGAPGLAQAIDGLYDAFAGWPLREWTDPCPCCASVEEERALHAAPLRQLGAGAIASYASHALLTWGDERDFGHFLPRIFEIVAGRDTWPDVEVVMATLRRAGWRAWPEAEQRTIERYLSALWRATISADRPTHGVEDVLCAIAQAVDGLTPYLVAWEDDRSVPATGHLVQLVLWSWHPTRGRLANAFWGDRRSQEREVIDWLAGPAVAERLTEAATDPASPWSDEAQLALQAVTARGPS